MNAEKKRLRDEVAELSEAVRALRDELMIMRATHHHDCHCVHATWVYPNVINLPSYQLPQVWSGTVTYNSNGNTLGLSS
jgi:hypothetical protein